MIKNILVIASLMLVFGSYAMAQSDEAAVLDNALKACQAKTAANDEEKPCLETALDVCVEKDDTAGWGARCATRAEQLWDKELNKVYKELQGRLTLKERSVLISSQRSWILYRNAEFKLIDSMYSFEKGTMNISFNAHARKGVVMKRALALKHYLEGYSPDTMAK
ncbi:MAG: DUF1311 domain-containing protein [Acidobacteria bacterium]|nr:DUF1311 domain-containing protein [Acidobacteriota bacterium]